MQVDDLHPDARRPEYVGLVTRAVALGTDIVALNLIAFLAAAFVSLIASLLGHHGGLNLGEILAGGAVWLLWSAAYFVTFWVLTGQTPGNRLLGIRVLGAEGGTIGVRRAIVRFGALLLAALPFGAGFLPVLVDERRRALQDRVAKTVVCWDDGALGEIVLERESIVRAGEGDQVPGPGPAPLDGDQVPGRAIRFPGSAEPIP